MDPQYQGRNLARQVDREKYERLSERVVRNGNIDHYVGLFAWKDGTTGKILFPSREMAEKALDGYRVENKEYAELVERFESFLVGSSNKDMSVTWTDGDWELSELDPAVDTIPGNAQWNVEN
ncbi:hypothetical protein G7Y89_g4844 [Cudoniella acicularis]|uniref:Uncharacterized protein n=1 Tax=Cudoniella acicularis TaxID=354080 RepID=A0A8H4RQ35_9HELO|nr:hypothetical protein G7Y89_g4844 [Cudoniella acicularis]